jgi:hypothetical protein
MYLAAATTLQKILAWLNSISGVLFSHYHWSEFFSACTYLAAANTLQKIPAWLNSISGVLFSHHHWLEFFSACIYLLLLHFRKYQHG